jgi:hypothetical protein
MLDKSQIKDLDEIVLEALELFSRERPPKVFFDFQRPLVVGSVNAAVAGRILFQEKDAVFADESSYKQMLESSQGIDGAIIVSASGAKSAPGIAKELRKRGLKTILLAGLCLPKAARALHL